MAQPHHAIEYLGAIQVVAGTQYTSASVISAFPLATVMKMKTDDVMVGINGGVMFHITYNDESYITTGKTYIFDKKCVIAVGIYKAVV
jgi:hypothetical protein